MVETSKQVRVDNWGIYFLQRLQLFFSKTDFCDLTLQFEGNVQLKVHRLVMNACTEYFGFLEQTCPAHEDNTIMMPPDLQADVIVPIVNFMYTGMLEYHASIYDKLYAAANTMNIAVLTKLLEAQLPSVSKMYKLNKFKKKAEENDSVWKDPKKEPLAPVTSPVPIVNKRGSFRGKKQQMLSSVPRSSSSNATRWTETFESRPSRSLHTSLSDNTPKPTRFEWPEDDLSPVPGMYTGFDEVSLTSKPLWTKDDDHKDGILEEAQRALDNSSRSKHNSISQDVEEEPERKVNVSNLESGNEAVKRKSDNNAASSPKRIKITNTEDETVISLTTSNPSEVDHTKIVSEILKKYPELVKKKKNIKLKITQSKPEPTPTKASVMKEKPKPTRASPVEKVTTRQQAAIREVKKDVPKEPPIKESGKRTKKASYRAVSDEGPWICLECYGDDQDGFPEFVLYYLFRKHMSDHHHIEFDSSLCKYCGKKCTKENYMIYHLYTKHGLKPAKSHVFPKCNNCPFIAVTEERLEEHMKNHGPEEVQCRNCQLGFKTKDDLNSHQRIVGHTKIIKAILDCAYCQKKLQSPVTLFTHIRAQHLKEARRDGITSLNEIMDVENEECDEEATEPGKVQENVVQNAVQEVVKEHVEIVNEKRTVKRAEKESFRDRVKIISNVKVAKERENAVKMERPTVQVVQSEQAQETVAVTTATTTLANIGGNIGGSIATNLGLVDIVVLEDNQQYILQQPQGQVGGADFILPPELTSGEGILQAAAAAAGGDINSTDELVMVLTDHDYPEDEQNQGQGENSNIVVLYSHPVEGQQGQFITSQGNLLVNSDGMLEIRNGASITTTAGQIIMDNTTTTQAIESPIESIDLIRKEIEGTGDSIADTADSALKNEENDLVDSSTEEATHEPQEEQKSHDTSAEEETRAEEDTTDAAEVHEEEEPMEVDENEMPIEEHNDEETSAGQENTEAHVEPEPKETPEEPCENNAEPEESQDIPPENPESPKSQREETVEEEEAPQEEILTQQQSVEETAEEPPEEEEEPMEVDGTHHHEQAQGTDEVDQPPLDKPEESVQCETGETQPENEVQANGRPAQNEANDSNDNVQPVFEDFTDESQLSAEQKTNKDLNKEILDDWDDTDSQASQTVEGEPQEEEEEEHEPNEGNATENVTKLMDDWEEEEEDQHKE